MDNQELKHTISVLDKAYANVLSVVRGDDDWETINLIQPILDKIDEIQNEIEMFQNKRNENK